MMGKRKAPELAMVRMDEPTAGLTRTERERNGAIPAAPGREDRPGTSWRCC